MTQKRIYAIQSADRTVGLVRATTPSQALRHHTAGLYSVDVASQDQLVAALTAGITVADAGRHEPEPPVLRDVIDDGHDGSETD